MAVAQEQDQTLAAFVLDKERSQAPPGGGREDRRGRRQRPDRRRRDRRADEAGPGQGPPDHGPGALKGGVRGAAIGVVVGAIIAGPAGAVVGGAAGRPPPQSAQPLPRHRHRRQVHEAGRERDREGQERPVRPVRGQLGRVDRRWSSRRSRPRTPCSSTSTLPAETAAALQGAGRARRRGTGWRRGGRRLRDRGRGSPRGGRAAEEAAPVRRGGRPETT